jgi:hypothetical protein
VGLIIKEAALLVLLELPRAATPMLNAAAVPSAAIRFRTGHR